MGKFNTEDTEDTKKSIRDSLSSKVIGCAIEVHRNLGPGLLESTYEHCLAHELNLNGIQFARQVALPVSYKDIHLDCGYRVDLLVEAYLIIELKATETLSKLSEAQLLTYMKLAEAPIGLIINFGAQLLKDGIKRFVL